MSKRILDIGKICEQEKNTPKQSSEVYLVPLCGVDNIPDAYAYDPDDVASVADNAHTIMSAITLKAGYYWTKWNLRKGLTYKAEPTGEEDAEQVQVTLANGFMPKITNLKTWTTNQGINGRFLVLSADRNGSHPRLIGEADNGARVKVTEDNENKNGYFLEITCLQDEMPFYYAGDILPLNP